MKNRFRPPSEGSCSRGFRALPVLLVVRAAGRGVGVGEAGRRELVQAPRPGAETGSVAGSLSEAI